MKTRLLLFFVPLFLSASFINRAYFVDDSYFVEIARWLTDHPDRPYDFRADDAGLQNPGWEKNGFVRMVNPLGHQYFLASLIKMGGERTWWLRLGCVLLSCFSALFVYGLARRLTDHPTLATLLVLVTPACWLSAHSLLIDSTMAFFFLGGLYLFFRWAETGRLHFGLSSGLLMGCAILTKYPAVFVLPLSAIWLALRWRKIPYKHIALVTWIVACGFLLAYSVWTNKLYGAPHIFAASSRMVGVFGWPKILSFFIFLSGVSIVPLLGWVLADRKTILISLLGAAILMFIFTGPYGGFTKTQGLLLSLWFVTSILILGLFAGRYKMWIYPRDHFLFLWVIGFAVMMLIVMGWVAARYYVIVIPALIFMVVRLVEMRWVDRSIIFLKPALAVVFIFSTLLAYADYKQAEPSRLIGPELKAAGFNGGERHFYLGDSFTMSYLRDEGWIPCFPETEFQLGDFILAKEVTMPLSWFQRKPVVLTQVRVFDYPTQFPLKVMDYEGSAGFYASVWGALPFTFSRASWERFRLFHVTALKPHDPE